VLVDVERAVHLPLHLGAHCGQPDAVGGPTHLRTDLVESALSMAVAIRGELAAEVILHADYAEVCVKPRIGGDGLCRRGLLADSSA
jgi:hypothetical protein